MSFEELLSEFREILALEERAAGLYTHYIEQIDDEDVKEKFLSILNDENKHVEIARKLIECVS